ncbi:MAG: DUF1684 domain-containing protein [Melioribacter sp.]|nr:DUF1684 domain-containing protein [Melioribacter sp.]
MKKKINIILKSILTFSIIISIYSCSKKFTDEELSYIKKIEAIREEKNNFMKNNPYSPFNYKRKLAFHKLNYYDVDPSFVFKSKLYEYNPKDTIIIFGTKGEPRKTVRYGYLIINYQNKNYKVNVYESKNNGEKYYTIWFTDKTTNKETYGVGRYLDFEKQSNPNYIYTIDFNLAYNPYCAYNSEYSCAIPTKEDFIPIEIKAGEKKFHN